MTWEPMYTAHRDGRPILVVLETPEEEFEGHHYPVEREYVVVRYKPAPFRSSEHGAFVWRQNEGSAIAENVPVAWCEIEEFGGW